MRYVKTGEKDGLVILSDENGKKASYEFLDMYVFRNAEYAVLLQSGDDMVTIFGFCELENGGEEYSTVEDDEAFSFVYERFKEEFSDEFDFD